MTPLSTAIIGCGRIAFEFEEDPLRKKPASHYGAVSSLPRHFRLDAICDTNTSRLDAVAERCGVSKRFTSHRSLFRNQVPDVAVIAASTPAHVDIATQAILAGVRGLILEKPVSASLGDSMKLLGLQQKNKIPILVFHERRYDPLYEWTAEFIRQEAYGPVHSVSARLCSASFPQGPVDKPYRHFGGGTLVHDGTHMIDILHYFFSPLKEVSAQMSHQIPHAATETSIQALLRTQDAIPIYLDIDGMSDYFHFELDILFRSARLRIGNGIRELYLSRTARHYSGFNSLSREPFPSIPDKSPFTEAYLDLYRALREQGCLRSSLNDGITCLERIYGIYRSASLSGRKVRFPLPSTRHPFEKISFFGHSDSVKPRDKVEKES